MMFNKVLEIIKVIILYIVCFFVTLFLAATSKFYTITQVIIVIVLFANLPIYICIYIKVKKKIFTVWCGQLLALTTTCITILVIILLHLGSLYKDEVYLWSKLDNAKSITIEAIDTNVSYVGIKETYFVIESIKGTGVITVGPKQSVNYVELDIINNEIVDIEGNESSSWFGVKLNNTYVKKHKAFYTLNENNVIDVNGDLEIVIKQLNNTSYQTIVLLNEGNN